MKAVLIGLILLLGLSSVQAEEGEVEVEISGLGLRVRPDIWNETEKPLDLSLAGYKSVPHLEKLSRAQIDNRYGSTVTPVGTLPIVISLINGTGLREAYRTYRSRPRTILGFSYIF